MESAMYRAGRRSQPKIPQTPEEFAQSLPNAEHFNMNFREVVQDESGDTAMIFFSALLFPLLSRLKDLSFDGTFFTVPKIFYQLFTIMCVIQGHSFPCFFILMSSKTQLLYNAAIQTLKDICPELLPQSLMGDFELASRNSMELAFPAASLGGCQFHYSQSLWKKIQKLGLSKLYQSNADYKKYVKKLMSLPYLPSAEISPAADQLFASTFEVSQHLQSQNKKLTKYIRRFWLGTITPDKLSVFDLPRGTNNDLESFHAQLKARIKTHQPNPWSFLGHLNNLISDVSLDIERLENGLNISRKASPSSLQAIQARAECKQKLTNGTYTPMKYLSVISYTFDSALFQKLKPGESEEESSEEEASPDNNTQDARRCPICRDACNTTYILVPCGHFFCDTCSQTLINREDTCAVCSCFNKQQSSCFPLNHLLLKLSQEED